MPIVFSPPAVSALKMSVARYLSGSRVLTPERDAGELLALRFAGAVFVFAIDRLTFELVLVSDAGRQLLAMMISSSIAARQKSTGGLTIELRIGRLPGLVVDAVGIDLESGGS